MDDRGGRLASQPGCSSPGCLRLSILERVGPLREQVNEFSHIDYTRRGQHLVVRCARILGQEPHLHPLPQPLTRHPRHQRGINEIR